MLPVGLLRSVPPWAWALVAALLWGGFQHHRAKTAGEELRQAQATAAQQEAQALRDNIAETERRMAAQQETTNAAHAELDKARRDAAAARDAAGRVRSAFAAYAASAASVGASAPGRSQAADASVALCTDLLGRTVARAAELADLADRSFIAGQACERSYGSLGK